MSISLESLKEALSIHEQISNLNARLNKILGGGGDAPNPFLKTQSTAYVKRGRRKMSASARAKIAAAQRARWAKQKGESITPAAKPAKTKRKMSAAGRAAIIAAQKKRWAAAKKR